jgi:hypothetical protein
MIGMANLPLYRDDETCEVDDAELLADLDAAMEEAKRGEGMDAFQHLRQVREAACGDDK